MPLLVLCGIQIICGLKSQPFEYILSMVVCFLPKGIYIVFVYMDSNTFGELPAIALLLMCANLCVVDLLI